MGRQQMWCSKKCTRSAVTEFKVQKGDVKTIRKLLLKRDKAICAHCAERDDKWQADHKTAVVNGGGGCAIDGFQTLCLECHKKKTKLDIAESKGRLPLIS
jgi:5-methylcytosine-specific restriction endonuclease McrA